jgi:hypothetical protein
MSVVETTEGRAGLILRVLAHGTIMVWDCERCRSYPYYKAGKEEFRLDETVLFATDATDTLVVRLDRATPPRKRPHRRPHATVSQRETHTD